MKIICSQSDLAKSLGMVSRAVPSKPTHPILGNILIKADTGTQLVKMTGYDLSLGISSNIVGEVKENGKVTVPAKLFTDIISKLNPNCEIAISYNDDPDEDDTTVYITSDTGTYQVRGVSADEFPELPTLDNGKEITLPSVVMREGLRCTVFASSTDETKQVLTGVRLTSENNSFELAATDGHRLSVYKAETEEADIEDFAVTIPARALKELEKMLGEDVLSLTFDESQVICNTQSNQLISRTLDGAYPAYHQLIPKQFSRNLVCDRKKLISSVERVAVLADQKNNIVRFKINQEDQTLTVSVETREVGSGKEKLSVQFSGESLEIAFNIKYLLEGLKLMNNNDVEFKINEPSHPVLAIPLGSSMTYLIMPVQIRD